MDILLKIYGSRIYNCTHAMDGEYVYKYLRRHGTYVFFVVWSNLWCTEREVEVESIGSFFKFDLTVKNNGSTD